MEANFNSQTYFAISVIDVTVDGRKSVPHADTRIFNICSVVLPVNAFKQMLSFIREHRRFVDDLVCQATRPIIACLNAAAMDVNKRLFIKGSFTVINIYESVHSVR